jgi:hypothetical protein
MDHTHPQRPGFGRDSEILQTVDASDETYRSLKNVHKEHMNNAEGQIREIIRNTAISHVFYCMMPCILQLLHQARKTQTREDMHQYAKSLKAC